jgi:hypothetical protein
VPLRLQLRRRLMFLDTFPTAPTLRLGVDNIARMLQHRLDVFGYPMPAYIPNVQFVCVRSLQFSDHDQAMACHSLSVDNRAP